MPRYSLNAFGRKIPLADTSEPLSKQVGRRLQGTPDTKIDSGGSVNSFTFDGQEISSDELREIKEIRESGGVISALMRSKALLTFGAGVSFEVEDNEDTLQEVNGRELTLEEFLRDRLNDIDSLVLELGQDALWYPYAVAEPLENRRGGFGGVSGVEPWTVIPETDEYGNILYWNQMTQNGDGGTFDTDELVHFPLNKSSARDKTGISSILRSREEIEQFRANQQAIKSAIELHGFPQRHVKVGREGSAPIRDNELRRVRNLFDSQTVDSDTVFVTGNDVEIDALEAENFEFERVSENDMRQLSLALGVPLELTNYGSDGLGSGKPAEFRLNLFKLQIEANQRTFANIFVRDLLRPVLRDMTPYDHTANINMELGDPLQTEKDMATLLKEIGGHMTNAEISERYDLPMPEDEEIAESYRTPAEIEQAEEQGGGPGEGDMGGIFGSDFRHERALDTPQSVPDNAISVSDPSEIPEGASPYRGDQGGLYYLPEGEDPAFDQSDNIAEQVPASEDEIQDFDAESVEEGDQIVVTSMSGEVAQVEVIVSLRGNIVVEDSEGNRMRFEPDGASDNGEFEAVGHVDPDADTNTSGTVDTEDEDTEEETQPETDEADTEEETQPETDEADTEEETQERDSVFDEPTEPAQNSIDNIDTILESDSTTSEKMEQISEEVQEVTGIDTEISSDEENISMEDAANAAKQFVNLSDAGQTDNIDAFEFSDESQMGIGVFNRVDNSLKLDAKTLNEEDLNEWYEDNKMGGNSVEWVVSHEVGHAMHDEVMTIDDRRNLRAASLDNAEIEEVEEHISDYAASKPTEFVAEGYAAKVTGDGELPSFLDGIYEAFDGPEVK